MSILTAEARKKLPDSAFALPGRRFPIHDAAHARDALARAPTNLNPEEASIVRSKVAKKFPNIKVAKNPHKKGSLNHMMSED